jgi:hypothetical protein
MNQTDKQYEVVARRNWEKRIYDECDIEDKLRDAKQEMFGDEAEYLKEKK